MSEYGRAGTKAATLRQAFHECLLEHEKRGELPTSNRFILYELRPVLDLSKTRKEGRGADQDLADASKWLRDHGFVPWSWIVDERRSLTNWRFAATVADYVIESVPRARVDLWGGEPAPLLLCESATFGGVLKRGVAEDYLCPVAATSGQVGGFLRTNIVPLLRGNDRPVLYVGDFDLSGGQIEENTCRVLVQEAGERDWRRLALTAEQAKGLPSQVKVDKRYRPPRTHEAVEVEAKRQGPVEALVRDALDALLPEPLADVQEREQAQREATRRRLESGGSP